MSILGAIVGRSDRIAAAFRRFGLAKPLRCAVNLLDRLFIGIGTPPLRVKTHGVVMYGYFRHIRYLRLIASQAHEAYALRILERHLRPGYVFVDGGAHIGLYALYASRLIGQQGMVVAFEPDRLNVQTLKFNVAKNKASNAIVVSKALSDKVEDRDFYRSQTTLSGSLLNRKDVETFGKSLVQTTTLDHELADSDLIPPRRNVLVKLDLEGAEPQALQGMKEFLLRTRNVGMLIEINPCALANAGDTPDVLYDFLLKHGFAIQYVDERQGKLVPFEQRRNAFKGNLFCVKGTIGQER